jgi:hypothetical protein
VAVAGAEFEVLQSNAKHFVAAPGVGRESTMNPESKTCFWRRPRLLMLVVLFVIAAPIVVANLSRDERPPQTWPPPNPAYGRPLVWY